MKRNYEKPLIWITVTLCTAVVAFSAGQGQPPKGEVVMNNSCVSCHDIRPIQMQAMDKDGWTALVQNMIQKGAQVKGEDVPTLVEYLTQEHGPLPNGTGKAILLDVCTMCHDLHRIREHGATREEWEDLLVHMINEGAPLSDDDFPVLLNYLSRNFRPREQ
jgi:cytochrome c5